MTSKSEFMSQGHFQNDIDDGTFAIYLYKQEKSLYDQNVIGEFLSEVDRKEVKMIFDSFRCTILPAIR